MEVILLEKIQNLGSLGDRAVVKPGYARNFLVPQGKALPATEANMKVFEERRSDLEKAQADELAAAQARAREIEAVSLRIERKVGDGRLFGSVSAPDLVEALAGHGIEVGRSEVRLPDGPIRSRGHHEVQVHVHPDVDATVAVQVVSDDAEEEAAWEREQADAAARAAEAEHEAANAEESDLDGGSDPASDPGSEPGSGEPPPAAEATEVGDEAASEERA